MDEYKNESTDYDDRPVEREFVLMPLFRRLRERFAGKPVEETAPIPQSEDTVLIYPDRYGNYHPEFDAMSNHTEVAAPVKNEEPAWEATHEPEPMAAAVPIEAQREIEVQPSFVEAQAHNVVEPETFEPAAYFHEPVVHGHGSSAEEPAIPTTLDSSMQAEAAAPVNEPVLTPKEPIASFMEAQQQQTPDIYDISAFAQPAKTTFDHGHEHFSLERAYEEESGTYLPPQTPLTQDVPAASLDHTEAEAAAAIEKTSAEPEGKKTFPWAAKNAPSEAPEHLPMANLGYALEAAKQDDPALREDRRNAVNAEPRIRSRQVTVTVPEVNWKRFRPNWAIMRPALGYGAIGFFTCLLLFMIPALRRPASSLLPGSVTASQAPTTTANVPQPSVQPVAAKGYTLHPGTPAAPKGYTIHPRPSAASTPAAQTMTRTARAKSHSARQQEAEVVVHHYDSAKNTTPHAVRASDGVKRYSDLN